MWLWTFVYAFIVWMYVFIYLGCLFRSGIAESHSNSKFDILRNCYTGFQSSCTILHSHQQCVNVPVSPHPCQHLLFAIFQVYTILVAMKWYLIVVLICIFLTANDVDHLLMCLSSLQKCLFRSFTHFFKVSYSSFLLIIYYDLLFRYKCSLYNLDISQIYTL